MKYIIITMMALMPFTASAKTVVAEIIEMPKYEYVEECTGGGNFVEGAIVGGILGEILGGDSNNDRTIGALLGGAIAENSGKQCKKVKKQVGVDKYIQFSYNGWTYNVPF